LCPNGGHGIRESQPVGVPVIRGARQAWHLLGGWIPGAAGAAEVYQCQGQWPVLAVQQPEFVQVPEWKGRISVDYQQLLIDPGP